ncbi:MAG: 3-dehydroquinate synthase [Oscillospiraceae bacterium]
MQTITLHASSDYQIHIGAGLLKTAGETICTAAGRTDFTAVIVSDSNVAPLYADALSASLDKAGIRHEEFVFPAGEQSKSHAVLLALYEFLTVRKINRSDVLIALGGGVVGDLTGFAAATYLRGVDVVQIPTTLLAQTDSSVGGKTAVNIEGGKNLIGAFKQPLCVIADTATLGSLPADIYADGMSEVIKYGCFRSKALFDLLDTGDIAARMEEIITACVQIKATIVERDETDKGERMLLNFGHTIGHALEKHYHFSGISHGRAVAIGMCVITRLTEQAGITTSGTAAQITACLEKYGLPTATDIPLAELAAACLNDKKCESGGINLILLREIGDGFIKKYTVPEFYSLLGVTLKG